MAYRFLLHYKEISYVNGMNFALKLYDELCDSYKQNKNNTFTNNFSTVSQEDYRFSVGFILLKLAEIKHYNHFKSKIIKEWGSLAQGTDNETMSNLAIELSKAFPSDETVIQHTSNYIQLFELIQRMKEVTK